MTARSVVLSVLLGAHPAWATAAELVRLTSDFGIKEPTVRVALTRMVSAGDLVRSQDGQDGQDGRFVSPGPRAVAAGFLQVTRHCHWLRRRFVRVTETKDVSLASCRRVMPTTPTNSARQLILLLLLLVHCLPSPSTAAKACSIP